jgi:hypothetical protein
MSDTSLSGFKAPDFGKTHEEKTRSQLLKQFMDAETLSNLPYEIAKGRKEAREAEQRAKMEARLATRITRDIPMENYRASSSYDDDATYKPGAFLGLGNG